jgi:hypothetical protein
MESAAATVKYLLFLPERYLPDEFYTTVEKRVDFGREEFKPYLIYMDIGGQWMKDVFTIIEGEQCPRRSGQRPVRAADIETHTSKRVWSGLRVWSLQSEVPQREISAPGVLSFSHQKWFYGILERCARESHGLIVALSPEHPMGDFAFCLYDWTEAERAAFFSSQTTPKTLHELPPATPLTTLYVFARDAEMTRQGPLLTSPQFRRVNSCVEHRLLMFDIMSSEVDTTTLGPVFFIPTQDMSPLEAHMSIHEENLSRNKNEKFSDRVPLVSEMLHSGRAVTDYVVGARGPLLYDKIGGASVIWKLLCSFAGRKPFQYPSTIERQPHEHHATVQRLNERLLEELNRAPVERLYHNLEDEVLADEVSNPM